MPFKSTVFDQLAHSYKKVNVSTNEACAMMCLNDENCDHYSFMRQSSFYFSYSIRSHNCEYGTSNAFNKYRCQSNTKCYDLITSKIKNVLFTL